MMDVLDDDMGTAALWREQPLITAYWVRAQTVGFVGRTIEEFQAARGKRQDSIRQRNPRTR